MAPLDIRELDPSGIEHKIVRSIERLDIDPSRFVVVGSAALKLYGIKLPNFNTLSRYGNQEDSATTERPGDVDLNTQASLLQELYEAGATPSGAPIKLKQQADPNQTILAVERDETADTLPVDMITRYKPERGSIEKYDAKMKHYYASHSVVVPGADGIRVASPDHLKKNLRRNSSDPKYRDDLDAFLRHEAQLRRKL